MANYRVPLVLAALTISVPLSAQDRLQSSDLVRLHSVTAVLVSPDGRGARRLSEMSGTNSTNPIAAEGMTRFNDNRRPYIFVVDVASGAVKQLTEGTHSEHSIDWHGENDNDVPIAEAEQYHIGLRDVGTEAVMVRYPREGHGIRESKHIVDSIDRSIRWYEKHFPAGAPKS